MDVIYDEHDAHDAHDAHDGGSCLGDDAYPHGLEGLDTLFCARWRRQQASFEERGRL